MKMIVAALVSFTAVFVTVCLGVDARDRERSAARQGSAQQEDAKKIARLLTEAAAAAREIEDRGPSAYALLEIAGVQARAGNRAAARALIDEALRVIPSVKRSHDLDREQLTAFAAAHQAQLDDLEGALKTIEALGSGDEQDAARMVIVDSLLAREQCEAATHVCSQIEDADARDKGYAEIAASLARAAKLDDARSIVGKIERESIRSTAILVMVEARIASQDFESAKALADTIGEAADQLTALCEIAESQLGEDGSAQAKQLLREAQQLAKKAGLRDAPELLVLEAKLGDAKAAVAAADSLGDSDDRDSVIHEIVLWLAEKGRIDEAAGYVASIKNELLVAGMQQAIAVGQAAKGDIAGGLKAAGRIKAAAVRGEALQHIAIVQIEKGDGKAARSTLTRAAEAAGESDDAHAQIQLLSGIAAALVQAGDNEAAKRTFREAVAASEAHDDQPYLRAALIGEIAKAQSHCGLSDDAAEWSRELPAPELRESALLGVAEGLLPEAETKDD